MTARGKGPMMSDETIGELPQPLQVSLSGGRTSGFMLKRLIDRCGGTLPARTIVTFFNTGKEVEQTLKFVRDISQKWEIPVVWLEYDRVVDPENGKWKNTYRVVDFESASRDGQPFEKLIAARSYLPNRAMRFCTAELKVRVGKKYLIDQGWRHWTVAIGIRADEPRRYRPDAESKERFDVWHPLVEAGIIAANVAAFWRDQPFDLGIEPEADGSALLGNCDCCFMKGRGKLSRIITRHPKLAGWWIRQEKRIEEKTGTELARFISRFSYSELLQYTRGGPMFGDLEEESCFCTD